MIPSSKGSEKSTLSSWSVLNNKLIYLSSKEDSPSVCKMRRCDFLQYSFYKYTTLHSTKVLKSNILSTKRQPCRRAIMLALNTQVRWLTQVAFLFMQFRNRNFFSKRRVNTHTWGRTRRDDLDIPFEKFISPFQNCSLTPKSTIYS